MLYCWMESKVTVSISQETCQKMPLNAEVSQVGFGEEVFNYVLATLLSKEAELRNVPLFILFRSLV